MPAIVQRVAAIHDLSGFGKASLTIAIPVLSAMGIQVCPLPTAVLSTHTGFPHFTFLDLTSEMERMIAHWRTLKLQFDAIYSGFLGSVQQVDIVRQFVAEQSQHHPVVMVDPVMADNGRLYDTMGTDMVIAMRRLVAVADCVTPNITELALLTEQPYQPQLSLATVKEQLQQLAAWGPKRVVATSVPVTESGRYSVVGFEVEANRFWRVTNAYIPVQYPGTGDTFASVLLGCLLRGESWPGALDRAVQFVSLAIQASFGFNHNRQEGIAIERVLPTLQAVATSYSYEAV